MKAPKARKGHETPMQRAFATVPVLKGRGIVLERVTGLQRRAYDALAALADHADYLTEQQLARALYPDYERRRPSKGARMRVVGNTVDALIRLGVAHSTMSNNQCRRYRLTETARSSAKESNHA